MDISQFQSISTQINDPFSLECVQDIHIVVNKYGCNATVYFKNGDTSASHYMTAVDYKEINEKIAEFISGLKSES